MQPRAQDLAPKNELCDEFLFTSHVMAACPSEKVKSDAEQAESAETTTYTGISQHQHPCASPKKSNPCEKTRDFHIYPFLGKAGIWLH